VLAGRVASVLATVLGATFAFYFEHVTVIFQLIIAIGTGPGLVLILRWFWWRINAWAELAAMVAGSSSASAPPLVPVIQIADFGVRITVTALLSAAVWIPVMFLTRPETRRSWTPSTRASARAGSAGRWSGSGPASRRRSR
jgi:solute:Na+ symporter, SSS family